MKWGCHNAQRQRRTRLCSQTEDTAQDPCNVGPSPRRVALSWLYSLCQRPGWAQPWPWHSSGGTSPFPQSPAVLSLPLLGHFQELCNCRSPGGGLRILKDPEIHQIKTQNG